MADRILSEIWLYPIKSIPGVRVGSARVLFKGLQFDRRWMLIDNEGKFLSQRQFPSMALFGVDMIHSKFKLKSLQFAMRGEGLELKMNGDDEGEIIRASIWEDVVSVTEPDKQASQWFSDCLRVKCRLVFFPEPNDRGVDPAFARQGEQVSLADAYPFLVIGKSSLNNLNQRLASPISMNRFRPNFVFEGGEPFEEDNWAGVEIGNLSFRAVKSCSRCSITTIDPITGKNGVEPLQTLNSFRKRNGKVYFGENLLALREGIIQEGDRIKVLDYKE